MENKNLVGRDERTIAIANNSYRIAYIVVTFALLVDVMVRSFKWGEAPWDLLGVVIGGGMVATIYQAWQKALPGGWIRAALAVSAVAAGAAAIAAAFLSQ